MDNFSYLIPKLRPSPGQNTEDLLFAHLEIPCPSAGSGLSAYLESDVSVDTTSAGFRLVVRITMRRPPGWRTAIRLR